MPSTLVSNSNVDPAVSLSGNPVRITGDVDACGAVVNGSGVEIDGQVYTNDSVKPLPAINISSYDPASQPLVTDLSSGLLSSGNFSGYVRRSGDLIITGPVALNASILYVDGNLQVNGPLSGLGAVFVTHDLTLSSASLGSIQQLALVSSGNLSITGGSGSSTLTGLVYSGGNLNLSGVTVVGAVVAASSTGAPLTMNCVNVVATTAGVNFAFNVSWSGNTTTNVSLLSSGLGGSTGNYTLTLTQSPAALLAAGFTSSNVNANSFTNATFCSYFQVSPPYNGSPTLTRQAAADLQLTQSGGGGNGSSGKAIALMVAQNLQSAASCGITSSGQLSLNLNQFLQNGQALQVVFRQVF